jgi:hypothetical protein
MNNDRDEIQDLSDQLNRLQLKQKELVLARLQRAKNSKREGVQETREFTITIGDKVLIRNPKRSQETRGIITKIAHTRVTITSERGNKLQREPKNLILEK